METQKKGNNIARAAIAGDPNAWESILSFSSKWTDAQARKEGFSPSEARELASDVAEKVRVCFVGFESRPGCSYEGWLYRVLQSCKKDRDKIRNRDMKRFTSLSAVVNQPTEESNAEEHLMQKDHQDLVLGLVLGAVSQLPELDQKILRKRYWEGMSYREIGEDLGLAAGTVRNRKCFAQKNLKSILAVCRRTIRFPISGGFSSPNRAQHLGLWPNNRLKEVVFMAKLTSPTHC